MAKRIFLLLATICIVLAFTACGNATQSIAEPTTAPSPPIIYGEWLWLEEVYYVFNEDGSGMRGTRAIVWATDNSVLTICSTPELCGDVCIEPETWSYVLTTTRLTITNRHEGLEFTYLR